MADASNTKQPQPSFLGTRSATLDSKGRVTFPSSMREQAPEGERERFVLAFYPSKCLALYTESGWDAITSRVSTLAGTKENWKPEYESFLYASAERVAVDGMGRILIPDEHREWAGLSKGVVFVGARSRVEVWAEDVWNERKKRLAEGFNVFGPELLR